ncbi:MAG: 3'-5' exoribonuclease [Paludibacteraceae bacterium]|nr:3'-5' exoribonuclease [Paludibacteraceae bacterium]
MNFVAFDIETATAKRSSICQIGITEVINGVLQEPKSWLIQPESNLYDSMNIWIHGITPEDTKDSPSFPEVWNEVYQYLKGKIVVAHNTSFDMYALRDAFNNYNMEYPTFDYFCTLRIARYIIKGCYSYSLNVVLDYMNIEFEGHHRADCDSLGCAKLLLKCLEIDGSTLDDLEEKYAFHRGKFDKDLFIPHLALDKYDPDSSYKRFIKNIQVDDSTADPSNYFYGKTVCFTGTCQYGVRKELLLKVAQVGGIPTDSVTAKTDILVVGQQDYRVVGEDGMSNKQEKAYKMLKAGKDIEILSETEFLTRI